MIIGTASSKMLETVIEEETIQLYRGDLVVQYTDGVTEAMNPKREEYGDDRLIDFVKNNNTLSANEFVSKLADNVESQGLPDGFKHTTLLPGNPPKILSINVTQIFPL